MKTCPICEDTGEWKGRICDDCWNADDRWNSDDETSEQIRSLVYCPLCGCDEANENDEILCTECYREEKKAKE
jgi:hypothetical protein